MAARLCANRASNEIIAKLDEVMFAMAEAAERADADGYSATDERLHELIMQGPATARWPITTACSSSSSTAACCR